MTTHPGTDRLLAHCRDLDRIVHPRPTARERLEAALGPDLARLLCTGLSARRGRPRVDPRAAA